MLLLPVLFSNPTWINGDNSRLFEFLAKPYSVTYDKYAPS